MNRLRRPKDRPLWGVKALSQSEEKKSQVPKRSGFQSLRILLCGYFILYSYIVARGMVPLPDEPRRINFWGLFCVITGMVIAFQVLVNRLRLFQLSIIAFLPLAAWQLAGRTKFLEMMLEPNTIEKTTRYTLAVILLVMLMPRVFRLFSMSIKDYKASRPMFFKKGIPF